MTDLGDAPQLAFLTGTPAERPTLLPPSTELRGFRLRLELLDTAPLIWRRLEVPSDLTLPRLHEVIQAAMGWLDGHLHRFRTGADHRSPYFLTGWDVEEGEEGLLEDDIRLNQVLGREGDELWYDYDFGDGWDHRLVVEAVLDEPPATAACTNGSMACPPEDCGGIGGHQALAEWVRSGYDDELLPQVFLSPEDAHGWLPPGWHPDHFDIEAASAAVALVFADPVDVVDELAEIADEMERYGVKELRQVLARPQSHASPEIREDEATRLTAPYRILLDIVGEGVTLTSAGYLPPTMVERVGEGLGLGRWWIGKMNREDQTFPVARLRATARALGLVSVRKGRLTVTASARRCRQNDHDLWRHIVSRLPLGSALADRHAGWMALAVVGSETPAEQWNEEISELLFAAGWHRRGASYALPPAHSPTLEVLEILAGATSNGAFQMRGVDPAVAATARAVIQRPAHQ